MTARLKVDSGMHRARRNRSRGPRRINPAPKPLLRPGALPAAAIARYYTAEGTP